MKQVHQNKKSIIKKIFFIISSINIIFLFLGIAVVIYMENNKGIFNIEEIIFYLQVPVKQAGGNFLEDFLTKSYIWILVCCVLLLLWFIVFMLTKEYKWAERLDMYVFAITTSALICTVVIVLEMFEVPEYILNKTEKSSFIEDNYVKTQDTKITFPYNKRNLIWIYMESMETTYASKEEGGALNENLIPELTELAENNINFSENNCVGGGTSSKGTDWTTGGLFAQTCGLPMLLGIGHGDCTEYKKFAPGAEALGDILKKEGYYQKFMFGSNSVFGGRKSYLEKHGSYSIYDYNTAIKNGDIPKNYFVWWGFEDNKLYKFAKSELEEIVRKNRPFALSLLTVDTHFYGGYICEECKRNHKDTYSDVIQCASRQVANFIEWVQKQDFYENTTIIITGDHPTMDENFISQYYDNSQPRKVYNCIINAPLKTKYEKNRKFNTFDMYPTALAALGARIKGDRLGLGTNLFSGEKTLAEKYGYNKIDEEFSKKSTFYNRYIW